MAYGKEDDQGGWMASIQKLPLPSPLFLGKFPLPLTSSENLCSSSFCLNRRGSGQSHQAMVQRSGRLRATSNKALSSTQGFAFLRFSRDSERDDGRRGWAWMPRGVKILQALQQSLHDE